MSVVCVSVWFFCLSVECVCRDIHERVCARVCIYLASCISTLCVCVNVCVIGVCVCTHGMCVHVSGVCVCRDIHERERERENVCVCVLRERHT